MSTNHQKPKAAKAESNVSPITNRIVVRRNEARRRALLAPNNPHCHILSDDFAMLVYDSMRGVYLVQTSTDEKTAKDVVIRVAGPILKNSSIIIDRVAITDDQHGTSYYFLTLTNDKGEQRRAIFTFRKFKDGSFQNQLAGHTIITAIKKHCDRLPEFLEELTQAQRPVPLIQTAKRVYGWHHLSDAALVKKFGDVVFLLENGCETKNGFVDSTAAPLFLDSDGNFGYTGATAGKPDDAVMELLLCKLNPHPSFDAILFALIGAGCHVSFVESNGVAPSIIEICAPMRLGKSGIIDLVLHLLTASIPESGTGAWQLPPVFNDNEDTAKGQGHLRAMFRYLLFQLPDLKALDETADAKNDRRVKTNEAYGDSLSAGVTSSIDQMARSRKARAGAPVRTAEEDFALNSIRRKNGSAEFRVNTFLWPMDEECERDGCGCDLPRNADGYIQSNEKVSRQIADRRIELYAWGAAYRRWQMGMTPDQRKATYTKCLSEARQFVFDHWHIKKDGGMHSGSAVYVLTGVLLWLEFLRAQHPQSLQLDWFDLRKDIYLSNRLARTHWIIEQTEGNQKMTLSEFVLDIIRRLLLNGDYYIADNRGEPLESREDLPLSMVDLGYVSQTLNGNNFNDGEKRVVYRQKKMVLGYLSKDGQHISFQSDDFYRVLLANANGQHLAPKNSTWEDLCKEGTAIRPNIDKRQPHGHRHQTRIGRKKEWCIRIPVSKIWDLTNDNMEETEHE